MIIFYLLLKLCPTRTISDWNPRLKPRYGTNNLLLTPVKWSKLYLILALTAQWLELYLTMRRWLLLSFCLRLSETLSWQNLGSE